MVIGLLVMSLLAGAQAVAVPPAVIDGLRFACRISDGSGRTFAFRGATGHGFRYHIGLANLQDRYNYDWPDARLDDEVTGFSGRPQVYPGEPGIRLVYSNGPQRERNVLIRPTTAGQASLSLASGNWDTPPDPDPGARAGICQIEAQWAAGTETAR